MTYDQDKFDHVPRLASFGLSEAEVPICEAMEALAARLQLELVESILQHNTPTARTLAELPEPELMKVNYHQKVRASLEAVWKPLMDDFREIPRPQLLDRLNSTWTKAEQQIGGDASGESARIFEERVAKKTKIIESEAVRQAAERGLPASVTFLDECKKQSDQIRKRTGDELTAYEERRKRQAKSLEEIKERWSELLVEESCELGSIAWRFLVFGALALAVGVGSWFLALPMNSPAALLGMTLLLILGFYTVWPILQRYRQSRRLDSMAAKLATAYKSFSLFSLAQTTKRQEMEYYGQLRAQVSRIQEALEAKIAAVGAWRQELKDREAACEAVLFQAPPTIRPLLRDGALEEWFSFGKSQAPLTEWRRQVVSLDRELSLEEMELEARKVFSFLRTLSAEQELYKIYPNKEDRLCFLRNLYEEAIGRTPGEVFISLNFAEMAGRAPEAYLFVSLFDPDNSNLAKEIKDEWGGSLVGLEIVPASDPSAITFHGLIWGIPLVALKEWKAAEDSFQRMVQKEGKGIYPVIYPEQEEEEV